MRDATEVVLALFALAIPLTLIPLAAIPLAQLSRSAGVEPAAALLLLEFGFLTLLILGRGPVGRVGIR